MKKLFYLLLISLFVSSCEKQQYCAQCIEQTLGTAIYYADDVCGTSSFVDAYIDEMETWNPDYPDHNWSCQKVFD